MTGLIPAAAAVLAAASVVLGVASRGQVRRIRLQLRAEVLRADRAEQAVDVIRADADLAGAEHAEAVADLDARLVRVCAERDTARAEGKAAAAVAGKLVTQLDHERGQHTTTVAAVAGSMADARDAAVLHAVTLTLLALATPPALPAAGPRPPALLASGDWLVASDPPVILPADDLDDAPPVPAPANGRRR